MVTKADEKKKKELERSLKEAGYSDEEIRSSIAYFENTSTPSEKLVKFFSWFTVYSEICDDLERNKKIES